MSDWKPPTSMSLGTVTQKFGKTSCPGCTVYAPTGVANWMPSLAAGTARVVAPGGPTVTPGAVGMPLPPVPASAAAPDVLPDEPPVPEEPPPVDPLPPDEPLVPMTPPPPE